MIYLRGNEAAVWEGTVGLGPGTSDLSLSRAADRWFFSCVCMCASVRACVCVCVAGGSTVWQFHLQGTAVRMHHLDAQVFRDGDGQALVGEQRRG